MPNRRDVIQILLLILGVLPRSVRSAAATLVDRVAQHTPISSEDVPTLNAFVDTLLPEYLGPGGSQVGVTQKLMDVASNDADFARLLGTGCRWLDRAAQDLHTSGFASAPAVIREAIVSSAEQGSADAEERQFFEYVKRHAFRHYYTDPRAWRYLSFNGPPQPLGFVDYARPPRP